MRSTHAIAIALIMAITMPCVNSYCMQQERADALEQYENGFTWCAQMPAALMWVGMLNTGIIILSDNIPTCGIGSLLQQNGFLILKLGIIEIIGATYWRYKYRHLFEQDELDNIVAPLKKESYINVLDGMLCIPLGFIYSGLFC